MRHTKRRRRTVVIILLAVGTLLLVGGFGLWVLYQLFPTLFPDWFDTLFAILAGLGALIGVTGTLLSDILLPLRQLLESQEPSRVWRLSERAPLRKITYDVLVARLGRSGRIPWIDRGIVSSSLLLSHGRIAIMGPMKSGKTREAVELIRMAQEDGWVSVVYEPTAALDLVDQNALAEAIAGELDPQRCLLFVDELGLRQDSEHLNRLSVCIESICKIRPDTYSLITIQQERLSPRVRNWLKGHRFHHVTMPALTPAQRRRLAEAGKEVLGVSITEKAVAILAESPDITKPWDIVSVLQYAPPRDSDRRPLDADGVRALLRRSEQDIWAEQRREVMEAEPAAKHLLESIVTFVSAGVTPDESTIRHYASYLMGSKVSSRERNRLLDSAAERWRRYDIVASHGMYTIPEPRLMPLILDTEEARARLKTFAETFRPGWWVCLVLTIMRPVDALVHGLRSLASSRFRPVIDWWSRSRWAIGRFVYRTALSRFGPISSIAPQSRGMGHRAETPRQVRPVFQ